jgi:hypothetical protein
VGLGQGFAVGVEMTWFWVGMLSLAALLPAITALKYLLAKSQP